MRKLRVLMFVICGLISIIESFAQTVEIKTGLNLSTMYFKNLGGTYSEDFQLAPRFLIGLTTEFPINKSLSFESGLIFSSKGYKIDIKEWAIWQTGEYFDLYENAILNYIDIPVSIKYNINVKKLKIFGGFGPFVGIGINGQVSNKEYTNNQQGGIDYNGIIEHKGEMGADGLWKRLDYGIQTGVGITLNKIAFRINYSYGLANIAQNSDTTNKNRVIGLSLGYIVAR